jgi:dihydrofolate reductase
LKEQLGSIVDFRLFRMRKIIVSEFVSLDGVMQAPGGADEDREGGFDQGGWYLPYWHDDIGAHILSSMHASDAMLLGRKTYQIHAPAFSSMPAGDPIADHMNNTPKYVVSTTVSSAEWKNSTLIEDNVVEAVRKLKQMPGKNISIDGSSVLVHTLARHDLIDEYSLLVSSVVVGKGKRLFPDGHNITLKPIESKTFASGVVLLRYQPDKK